MSAKMSLVWLTMAKALESIIAMAYSRCMEWETGLVETLCYIMCKRQEGRYRGVVGMEAMLVG